MAGPDRREPLAEDAICRYDRGPMMNQVLSSFPFRGWTILAGLAVATLATALGGACGGDEAAPLPPIAVESLRAEYESALCDFQVRCSLMPDKATCRRLTHADDEILQLIANVVYGKLKYDPVAGRAWVEATRARTCDDLLSAAEAIRVARRAVFHGAVPEGGPCLVDGECAGDASCDLSACNGEWCCLGACTSKPTKLDVGGDCSSGDPCVDTAYCDFEGAAGGPVTGTCQPRKDNGEDCTDPDGCKDGQGCAQGKCFIRSHTGQGCNPNINDACLAINNWCDPIQSKCTPLPTPGNACTTNDRCVAYGYCNAGTCQMRPVENEPCPIDGSPPRCLGMLRCDPDVCVAPPDTLVCVPSNG